MDRHCQERWARALAAAAGVVASCGVAAGAPVLSREVRYALGTGEVKRAMVTWEPPAAPVVSGRATIATVDAPSGVAVALDGDVLVSLRGGSVRKIDPATGASVGVTASSWTPPAQLGFLSVEPGSERALAVGVAGGQGVLARLPLAPGLGAGAATAVTGPDTRLADLAWAGGKAYYAARLPGASDGSVGEIAPASATTVRKVSGLHAALALSVDPRTGDLLLFGGSRVTQLSTGGEAGPMVVKSNLDLGALAPGIDVVDGTVDEGGRVIAAGADGRIVLIDMSVTRLVGAAGNEVGVATLDAGLRAVAPLSGPGSGAGPACLWDSGGFDGRTGQLSVATVWQGEAVAADDFYLTPGVHRVDRVTGVVLTNAPVPKARLTIYEDCDGRPGAVVATSIATSLDELSPPRPPIAGLAVKSVAFATPNLWLKGGRTYWASIAGVTLTGDEPWYWGTSGGGTGNVAGLPGLFRLPDGEWQDVSALGCGCTDFALAIEGASCKTLWDTGPAAAAIAGTAFAAPSHSEPGLWDVRAAEAVVNRTCDDGTLCHVGAVMYSNCSPFKGRFEVFGSSCGLPSGPVLAALAFTKVTDLGYEVTIDGRPRRAYRAEWGADGAGGLTLAAGSTLWVSPVGVGSGSATQGSYAAFASGCTGACVSLMGGAAGWSSFGAPGGWTRLAADGQPARSLSLQAHIDDPSATGRVRADDAQGGCAADINRDGAADILDILDYLSAFFAGCP